MSQSLQMESVITWILWEYRVCCTQKSCYCFVAPAKSISTATKEEKAYRHIDCHVVTIMHFKFKSFPQDPHDSKA